MMDTCHEEIIHDISFNYNGTRFATASSDQYVKVYSKINGQYSLQYRKWERDSEQKCHDGPVWRIRWAHPKFGTIFATCSQDKGVCVWKEKKSIEEDANNKKILKIQWTQKSLILEGKEAVADIQFGQKNYGLILAVAYLDGRLQIYKDYEQNQFLRICDVENVIKYGIRAISWNTAPLETEMIVCGGNHQDQQYRNKRHTEFGQKIIKEVIGGQSESYECNQKNNNTLVILIKIESQQQDEYKLQPISDVLVSTETIHDVQWANQNGRSFHLIATSGNKGVKIWKIRTIQKKIELLERITLDSEHEASWRISWNVLANMIAVSYSQQQVKLYQNVNNSWICKGNVQESMEKIPFN